MLRTDLHVYLPINAYAANGRDALALALEIIPASAGEVEKETGKLPATDYRKRDTRLRVAQGL